MGSYIYETVIIDKTTELSREIKNIFETKDKNYFLFKAFVDSTENIDREEFFSKYGCIRLRDITYFEGDNNIKLEMTSYNRSNGAGFCFLSKKYPSEKIIYSCMEECIDDKPHVYSLDGGSDTEIDMDIYKDDNYKMKRFFNIEYGEIEIRYGSKKLIDTICSTYYGQSYFTPWERDPRKYNINLLYAIGIEFDIDFDEVRNTLISLSKIYPNDKIIFRRRVIDYCFDTPEYQKNYKKHEDRCIESFVIKNGCLIKE